MEQPAKRFSVLVADDQQLFLEGLCLILKQESEIQRLITATNGADAAQMFEKEKPCLLITDLNMPGMDGFQLIRCIRKKYSTVKIIAVSVREDIYSVTETIKLGVNGFLNKICSKETLLQAVKQVLCGGNYFPPSIVQRLTSGAVRDELAMRADLSCREKDIMRLICDGKTTFEIADTLCISDQTVVSHRKNILCKLGVKNTAGAVYYAIRNGIID